MSLLGDYTVEDWKSLGLNTGKSAVIGGVSSTAIYGLTNYADLAAPFAGAVVTAIKGVHRWWHNTEMEISPWLH